MFWEAVNAIGVLQAPVVLSIWDDDYGISVPNEFQLTADLSRLLGGFQRGKRGDDGYDIYTVAGWDYPALLEVYVRAAETARKEHVPAIIHVNEMTQPQGHSTSGSHERYKSPERLKWEEEFDCIRKMRAWITDSRIASDPELAAFEKADREAVEGLRKTAWDAYLKPILDERNQVMDMIEEIAGSSSH